MSLRYKNAKILSFKTFNIFISFYVILSFVKICLSQVVNVLEMYPPSPILKRLVLHLLSKKMSPNEI